MTTSERWYENEESSKKFEGKGTIFIISENGFHDLYRSLSIENETLEIHSFRDALRQFRGNNSDVVLIDCIYDPSHCIDLISGIKALAPGVPIIMISGDTSKEVVAGASMAGARLFLKKPVNILELKNTLIKLLHFKRTSREKRDTFVSQEQNFPQKFASSATTDKPVNILKVIQFIEQNYSERINLESLAKEANLSKYHFCRFFNKYTGMSPMKFVNLTRIERAKEFLKRQDQTVSIISFLTGFNDLGTFIRQFKSITGLTPSLYQKSTVQGETGTAAPEQLNPTSEF